MRQKDIQLKKTKRSEIMNVAPFGKILIFIGIFIVIVGILMMFGGKLGIGKLPGDIYIQKGNFSFYFPLATSIILSIVLSVVLSLFYRR